MSPLFFLLLLELCRVLLHPPLKLSKSLLCVFLHGFSQRCKACLSRDPWSPTDMAVVVVVVGEEKGFRDLVKPTHKKHLPVCPLLYTIYLPWYTRCDCHESSRRQGGRERQDATRGSMPPTIPGRGHWLGSHYQRRQHNPCINSTCTKGFASNLSLFYLNYAAIHYNKKHLYHLRWNLYDRIWTQIFVKQVRCKSLWVNL